MLLSWTNKLKLIIALVAAVGAFILGAKVASTHTVETVTKEVKGETVTVVKDRIITVTKIIRPDGTVEETTKTEEKNKNKTEKETSKSSGDIIVYRIPNYSLGYISRIRLVDSKSSILPQPKLSHGAIAGYRLVNDIWLKAGAIPSDNIYMLGVEIRF